MQFLEILIIIMIVMLVLHVMSNKGVKNKKNKSKEANTREEKDNSVMSDLFKMPGATTAVESKRSNVEDVKPARKYPKESVNGVLQKLQEYDPKFELSLFLAGAKDAYKAIVSAYNDGNISELSDIVEKNLLDGLLLNIQDRLQQSLSVFFEFKKFKIVDVVDGMVDDDNTVLKVKFVSEQVVYMEDEQGRLLENNSKESSEFREVWTFWKKTTSNLHDWKLIAVEPEVNKG